MQSTADVDCTSDIPNRMMSYLYLYMTKDETFLISPKSQKIHGKLKNRESY